VGSHTVVKGACCHHRIYAISLGANGVLIAESNTVVLDQAAVQTSGPDVVAVGSHSYTAQQAASFSFVGSNTVVKGAPAITIASEPISFGANGALVAGSNTVELGPLPSGGTGYVAAGVIAIGSGSYTVKAAGFSIVLGSSTIAPGAPAITVTFELVSLGGDGLLVAGSNTMTLGSIPTDLTRPGVAGVSTIGSGSYSVRPTVSGFVMVGSNTISKGAPAVTITSEPDSLGSNGMLVAGSTTLAWGSPITGNPGSMLDAILSQGGPVPAPSGNPASQGGLTSNNGSSSNATAAEPFKAGGVRSWNIAGQCTWVVGVSTVVAVVTCCLL